MLGMIFRFKFDSMPTFYTCVALLIIKCLWVEILRFSFLYISIFDNIPSWIGVDIVSLSTSGSLLTCGSNFGCVFFSSFNFLIYVSKIWLWFLRIKVSSSISELLTSFLISWFSFFSSLNFLICSSNFLLRLLSW